MGLKGCCNHIVLLHNAFWQDEVMALRFLIMILTNVWLRGLFPGRQLQAHPIKQVWVLGTFSLGHRLRLERGFRKHNVLRTAFKRLTLVTSFAADWQTFLDTRNSTFCLHGDVCLGTSKYNRTNKASIQTGPPSPSPIPLSLALVFAFCKYKYLAHSSSIINTVTTWDTNRKQLLM